MPPDTTELSSGRRGLLSVKDTIESIVVAFILAFVFRAFVAEAFVIPTGSMAPNLYGIHRMQTCTACGTEYAYGFSPMAGGGLQPPGQLVCPNCGLRGDKQITTNPDNWASRRTCEIIGAEMVEIVDVPEYMEMYRQGDRQKCRYRLDL